MGHRWGRAEHFVVSPMRHPKTGVYWFRQAVPKAMQAAVAEVLGRPGKRHLELKWTLGTKDQAEAKRLWPGPWRGLRGSSRQLTMGPSRSVRSSSTRWPGCSTSGSWPFGNATLRR